MVGGRSSCGLGVVWVKFSYAILQGPATGWPALLTGFRREESETPSELRRVPRAGRVAARSSRRIKRVRGRALRMDPALQQTTREKCGLDPFEHIGQVRQ